MDISTLYRIYLDHPVITTDSRDCPEGSIFFALRGPAFDGNRFAKDALDKGCSYAVVDDITAVPQGDLRYIYVEDALHTLKLLANHHRKILGTKMIGITGTNGKTTTKELVAAVLGTRFRVLFTQGNFNNEIGVPKTLFRLTSDHDIAVIEMGASHPGDIHSLTNVAEPDMALITNVGRAHLQGFGSFEGVMSTKAELYDYMQAYKKGQPVFLNADNPYLKDMFERHCPDATAVTYSTQHAEGAAIQGRITGCTPYLSLQWSESEDKWHNVETHLVGAYNIDNVLAAITIGRQMGISPTEICGALQAYVPHNNRSQLEDTGRNHLIIDAYNANPSSMEAALDNFQQMEVSPKMVILGDMLELGDVTKEEHQKVVDRLTRMRLDKVLLVGEQFSQTNTTFPVSRNIEEAGAIIGEWKTNGYYVLIKGSNGIHLDKLKPLL